MDILENVPPALTLVIVLIVLIWVVLLFLVPFMIEGIRSSTRKSHEELQAMNAKLDRLTRLLSERAAAVPARTGAPPQPGAEPRTPAPGAGAPREPAAARRREPTISDPAPAPVRREPRL
jgi:hypothetical protein